MDAGAISVRFMNELGRSKTLLGRVGGEQMISIGPNCLREGVIIHEIFHALGFFHEHSRPDRDDYIRIDYDNLRDGLLHNFEPLNLRNWFNMSIPYVTGWYWVNKFLRTFIGFCQLEYRHKVRDALLWFCVCQGPFDSIYQGNHYVLIKQSSRGCLNLAPSNENIQYIGTTDPVRAQRERMSILDKYLVTKMLASD